MTRSDPLVVSEGEKVSVKGTVPGSVASLPEDQIKSSTTIHVSGIEGVVGFTSEVHPGTGPTWGGSVGVDDYLKWGVGLYLVSGEASGTPGWTCTGEGYVKLDGNPLSKPIGQGAAALTGIGAAGVALSGRPKKKPTAQDLKEDFGRDLDAIIGVGGQPSAAPPPGPDDRAGWGLEHDLRQDVFILSGCLFFLLGPLAVNTIARSNGAGNVFVMAATGGGSGNRRVWARGRPVSGAIFGLVGGLGVAVLGQQFALWPLTIFSAIFTPIWYAVVCGVFAWIGRPYRVVQKS